MIGLQYIDMLKWEQGRPKALFMIADMEQMRKSKTAIFGTGLEAYSIFQYLKGNGIEVKCFVNNDKNLCGRKLCGLNIVSPDEVMDKAWYVIVAMSQSRYNNQVLWQLKVHNQNQYGIAFIDVFHSYKDFSAKLHESVMEAINDILRKGKSREDMSVLEDYISLVPNVGSSASGLLGDIPEFCWTTTWSHCLMEWIYEKYANDGPDLYTNNSSDLCMLEIGAGQGLFSLTVHKLNPLIDIRWLMYNYDEKSGKAVSGKYTAYPDRLFKTYDGLIEEPSYEIEDKFDIIVMTEVMEHFVTNPVNTLKKIRNMLKEDGYLYLSTPNWGHLTIYDNYRELPEWTGLNDYKNMSVGTGHVYQYSKSELYEIFEESGLEIKKYALSDHNNHNIAAARKNFP